MEERVGQMEAEGRALEAARLRQRTTFDLEMLRELGYCSGRRELLAAPVAARAGLPAVDPAGLLPAGLAADRGRVAHDDPAGRRHVQERPDPQGDPGRLRLPAPVRAGQPAADVRGVRGPRQPGDLRLRDARPVRAREEPADRRAADPADRHRRPADHRPADRGPDRRPARGDPRAASSAASAPSSRRSPRRWPRTWRTTSRSWASRSSTSTREVDTLERVAILRDLRLGVYDVLVGINLLREGLDLPEVTLMAILDADKEGFLRSAWSLIQMIGRAARNTGGEVIMYADRITESMRVAIDETDRRRAVQATLQRGARHRADDDHQGHPRHQRPAAGRGREHGRSTRSERRDQQLAAADKAEVERLVARMEAEMKAAAKQLEFERAAAIRDEIQQIRLRVLEQDASVVVARAAERAAKDALLPAKERAAAHRPGGKRPGGRGVGRSRSPRSRCSRPARSRRWPTARRPGRPPSSSRGSATSTRTRTAGWQARWLDRPTWDRTVTPNIRKRSGQRPNRRTRGY